MIQQFEVHPAAECCRMMDDEELAGLAADIAENGQRDPVILGRINGHVATWLVDGRNRLKACEIAKVEPLFETIEFKSDDDIVAFVRSRTERRNLTKGQRAMALALLYPEPEKGGRGKTVLKRDGFSKQRLSDARTVRAYSHELALRVRDGITKLDEALAEVTAARKATESAEAMLTRLRAEAPDLADLVEEDRMSPKEAIAALDARIEEQQRKQRTATQLVASLLDVWHPRGSDPADYCARLTMNAKAKFWPPSGTPLTRDNLRSVAAVIAALENQLEKWEAD